VYGDKVRIVWKNMPLDIHKDAPLAHVAAMAAAEQGKFWEYHDKLFKNQPKIQRDFLLQYARELGLDMKKFEDSLEAQRAKPLIDADAAEAKTLGVTGTPAFFVNGRFLSGAKPFDEFAQTINAELTKKNLAVPPMPSPSAAGAKAGG
jgi:protein-disulfide isomerase